MATATNDKPVRLGDLPVVKTNILENARQYDKGVVGGYNGTFPLTAASQGGIYLLPSTGKFYVCETAYNGAQISAPNSNFVELSVWKNHDRLTNLNEIKLLSSNLKSGVNQIVDLDKYRYISLIYASSNGEGGDELTQALLSYTYTFDTRLHKIAKYVYCNVLYININNYKLKAKINLENNTLKIEGYIPTYVVGHNC